MGTIPRSHKCFKFLRFCLQGFWQPQAEGECSGTDTDSPWLGKVRPGQPEKPTHQCSLFSRRVQNRERHSFLPPPLPHPQPRKLPDPSRHDPFWGPITSLCGRKARTLLLSRMSLKGRPSLRAPGQGVEAAPAAASQPSFSPCPSCSRISIAPLICAPHRCILFPHRCSCHGSPVRKQTSIRACCPGTPPAATWKDSRGLGAENHGIRPRQPTGQTGCQGRGADWWRSGPSGPWTSVPCAFVEHIRIAEMCERLLCLYLPNLHHDPLREVQLRSHVTVGEMSCPGGRVEGKFQPTPA